MDWAETIARRDENHLSIGIWFHLYKRFYGTTENLQNIMEAENITLTKHSKLHPAFPFLELFLLAQVIQADRILAELIKIRKLLGKQ